MSRLLTTREMADMLGVSTETVLRWTRRHELPAIRLPGGAIRFREAEVEAWLEQRATTARGSATQPTGRHPRDNLTGATQPDRKEA